MTPPHSDVGPDVTDNQHSGVITFSNLEHWGMGPHHPLNQHLGVVTFSTLIENDRIYWAYCRVL